MQKTQGLSAYFLELTSESEETFENFLNFSLYIALFLTAIDVIGFFAIDLTPDSREGYALYIVAYILFFWATDKFSTKKIMACGSEMLKSHLEMIKVVSRFNWVSTIISMLLYNFLERRPQFSSFLDYCFFAINIVICVICYNSLSKLRRGIPFTSD